MNTLIWCTIIVSLDKNKHTSGTYELIGIIYNIYHLLHERKGRRGETQLLCTNIDINRTIAQIHGDGKNDGDGYKLMEKISPFSCKFVLYIHRELL